jgi:hypothetical protein
MKTRTLLPAAVELIRAAVGPDATVEPGKTSDSDASGDIRLRTSARERARSVRLRLWTGAAEKGTRTKESPLVWVLANAPPELMRRLREAGQSFVDVKRGVVRLAFPRLLIDRTDLQPPRIVSSARALLDPFGDRASLIVRVIVDHPGRTWTTRALASEVGVSTMTASHVIRQLDAFGVVEVQRIGRANSVKLRSLRRLIERWAAYYDWQRNVRLPVEAPVGSVDRFLKRLPDALTSIRWALTLQAGASLVAPLAAWDTIHIYVDAPDEQALSEIARRAKWPIGNGNVVLMSPWYTESTWFGLHKRRGIPVVSDLQLMLDLWHYPVRGTEQADHLLAYVEKRVESSAIQANG